MSEWANEQMSKVNKWTNEQTFLLIYENEQTFLLQNEQNEQMSKWAKFPYEQIWCQMSTWSSNLLQKYPWYKYPWYTRVYHEWTLKLDIFKSTLS